MEAREFEIKCPMCNGTIIIDAGNGKIIRHFEKEEPRKEDEKPDPAKFDQAMNKVSRAKDEEEETFKEALKKMSGPDRTKGLDELFKKAKEKADQNKDEKPRPEDHRDFWD